MKEPKIIISYVEFSNGELEGNSCHQFDGPSQAKEFILRNLEAESTELETPLRKGQGDIQNMFRSSIREGNFSYTVGDHEYHISFYKTDGEYSVSDDELIKTLEAYCNTGRSAGDYREAAGKLTRTMHRYVQSQLWKLIKALIRAFSTMNVDERNKTAAQQAAELAAAMEINNIE